MIQTVLGIAAATAILYYVYVGWAAQALENQENINDVPTFAFINPADDVANPARIGPVRQYNKEQKMVAGRYGIPKTYYGGVGGGTTPTYGTTWSNF